MLGLWLALVNFEGFSHLNDSMVLGFCANIKIVDVASTALLFSTFNILHPLILPCHLKASEQFTKS